MLFSKDHWKKEWTAVERKEQRFLDRMSKEKSSAWKEKIADKIPEKLEGTLNTAFRKAFELVFKKGTGLIEKTYDKEKQVQTFQINEYAACVRKDRKSVRAFARQAGSGRARNLLLSGIEGAGLGILGIGIPDIPLFTAMLLKSIYEIAISYGCSYETEEEQCFILSVIKTALTRGEELVQANRELNEWIDSGIVRGPDRQEQITRTSDALAEALLYMKFVQGIPIVGLAGGMADAVYLKRITDYADLKYRRRCSRRYRDGRSGM